MRICTIIYLSDTPCPHLIPLSITIKGLHYHTIILNKHHKKINSPNSQPLLEYILVLVPTDQCNQDITITQYSKITSLLDGQVNMRNALTGFIHSGQ
jgi:hypothetical protein